MIIRNRKKAAVYVDGLCEQWYFQMMKRNENALHIDLQPKLPRKKKLAELYTEVKRSANDYDLVVWIVDLDKVLEEEKRKKKDGKSPKEAFKQYYKELSKVKNIKVLISNPCLEYWFLLHFEYTAKPFQDCSEAGALLKKSIRDYDKSEKFFVRNDLYRRLKGHQSKAVLHAKRLGDFDIDHFEKSVCEVYKFFDANEAVNILKC